MEDTELKNHKCSCGKLLFKGNLVEATVEIKCKGCGQIRVFSATPDATPALDTEIN
jgi:phage FluMu protein Com